MLCDVCGLWTQDGSHVCSGARKLPASFSFGGLLPYARRIAKSPPVGVWRTKMDVPVTPGLAIELEKEILDEVTEKYQSDWQLKKLAENLIEPSDGHIKFAGTICDLTAYSMMVVAAGVDRIKNLNLDAPIVEGDHAERCKSPEECQSAFNNWAGIEDFGIVQIKFKPGTGAHTFVIERVWLNHGEPMFRVYQSYQGSYRLSDFLGMSDSSEIHPNEIGSQITKRHNALQNMRGKVGCGQLLSRPKLDEFVILPMSKSLGNGMSEAEYKNLTGGHTLQRQTCDTVLLLFCDHVDPELFSANYESLRSCEDMSPRWVEI